MPRRYPNLPPLVVQDLEATREVAETFIASRNLSDRVAFEAHDFFQPQSPTRAGKFLYVIQRGGSCLQQHIVYDFTETA